MYKYVIISFLAFCTLIACSGDKSKGTTSNSSIKKEAADASKKASNTIKDKSSEGATPEQIAKARQILEEVDDYEIDMIDSKKLYKIHCSICHGFKGDMMINEAKDLVKSRISIEEAVAQVYHGKGLMTPYKGVLTNPEIIAVSQYTEMLRR